MKRLIFLIILSILGILFVKNYQQDTTSSVSLKKTLEKSSVPIPTSSQYSEIKSNALFVPYWNLSSQIPAQYDKVIYFGISGGKDGINEDAGSQKLPDFKKIVSPSQKQYLTLRLLDTDTNILILEDKNLQKKIVSKTNILAKEYGFDGVVIDLELSVLPMDDISHKINDFISYASTEFQKNNLRTAVVLYGDVFYRSRPYDVSFINAHTDEIMVMAYDFSKSYGEPGPNFPLQGKETYGYDLETMINDYVKIVPPEKLTIIFGMYGWNWTLGPQGKPLKRATAMSLNDITESYLNDCTFSLCLITADPLSAETKITYTDTERHSHEVWFENEDSVSKKKHLLQQYGIQSIGRWVWGYF